MGTKDDEIGDRKTKKFRVQKLFKKEPRMKRIVLVVSIVVSLALGLPEYYLLGSEESIESSSAEWHLVNMDLLMGNALADLSPAGKTTLEAATVDSESDVGPTQQETVSERKITSSAETYHATIFGYKGAEIPDSLINNFDRIFRMIPDFLNFNIGNDKVVVWMMNLENLRQIPFGPQSAAKGSSRNLAGLYVGIFDYLLFTPQYMNDLYVCHELLHYFVDEYEEEVIAGLPEIIKKQNVGPLGVAWHYFLKGNEERIVDQLSKIIVRRSEHSFFMKKG